MLMFEQTGPELECTMIVKELIHGCENKIREPIDSSKVPSSKMKTDVCTSQIIMPCKLPELLACNQDNVYAVKDICVEEGVVIKDKILIENENDKNVGNLSGIMTKESDDEFLSPDGSLQSSDNDDDKDSQEIEGSMENSFVYDGTLGEENCIPAMKIAVESPGKSLSNVPLSQDFSSQKTLMSFLLSSDYDGHELDKPADKNPCSNVKYEIPISGLPCNGKLDSSTDASEFNSPKISCNDGDRVQQGLGESGFSKAGSSSGRITCSGPMLIYSGSVSIRSESSSTRSFAFPVLQPEWHTSPIKMAKPEGRKHQKHRGWRQALVCCRF